MVIVVPYMVIVVPYTVSWVMKTVLEKQSFQFEFTFFLFCFLSSQTNDFIILIFHCSKDVCQQLSEMAYC